ncbi:MAG: sensor histidine kinase, partial [Acidimicrobiales bacterium]
ERARSWHEEILVSARRLLRIVEMLEFFASSGGGRAELRPEPLDARALVREAVATWSGRLDDSFTVRQRVARDTPPVLADRRWLALAVDELVDNAVKFSPGGGRIVIGAAPSAPGSRPEVEITVADQGMGMTDDQHASAFGEFVQVDGSDTRRFGGLGLGLALVRRVVEGHGGEVLGRSARGRGTTITIRVPAAVEAGVIAHAGPAGS